MSDTFGAAKPTPSPTVLGPLGVIFLIIGCLMLGLVAPLAARATAPGFILLAVLGGGLLVWRDRRLPVLDWSVLVPLLVFIFYGALSITWTLVPKDATGQAITFLYEFLPAFLLFPAMVLISPGAATRLAKLLPLAALVGLLLLGVEVFGDQPIYRLQNGEPPYPWAFVSAVNRASVLVALMSGPVALLLWRSGRRLMAGIWLALVTVTCLLSESQSAAAAQLALLGLIALALWSPRIAAGIIAVGIVAGMVFCTPAAQAMLNAGLAQAPWMPHSFQHRILTWDFVVPFIEQKPWLGWGLDSARAIPGGKESFPGTDHWGKLPLHPHNFFLQVRLELGWIGAALVTWLLLAVLWLLVRLEGQRRVMALALFGTCIFIQCFAYGAWQTWLLCGMLFAFALIELAMRVPLVSRGNA
ncbi:O-antigen ligase family protein [Niveispirillum irakense]|uniref:O-antigen ligase family protein n=1 Tax=Niveispirillum irakense TaxID=34011 RepID=UPI0003F8A211|nr:O-antigen ligase family protein [Niveispirillum irakense]